MLFSNMSFTCDYCDYVTTDKSNFSRHKKSVRHLRLARDPQATKNDPQCAVLKKELECIKSEFDRFRKEKNVEIARLENIILALTSKQNCQSQTKKPKRVDLQALTDKIITENIEKITVGMLTRCRSECAEFMLSNGVVTEPIKVGGLVEWTLDWVKPFLRVTDKSRLNFLWIDGDMENVKISDMKCTRFMKKLFDMIDFKIENILSEEITKQEGIIKYLKKNIVDNNKKDVIRLSITQFNNTLKMSQKLATGKQNTLGKDFAQMLAEKLV